MGNQPVHAMHHPRVGSLLLSGGDQPRRFLMRSALGFRLYLRLRLFFLPKLEDARVCQIGHFR